MEGGWAQKNVSELPQMQCFVSATVFFSLYIAFFRGQPIKTNEFDRNIISSFFPIRSNYSQKSFVCLKLFYFFRVWRLSELSSLPRVFIFIFLSINIEIKLGIHHVPISECQILDLYHWIFVVENWWTWKWQKISFWNWKKNII